MSDFENLDAGSNTQPYDEPLTRNQPSGVASIHSLLGPSGPITSIAFSPDDKYIAAASEDKTIRVWYVESGLNAFTAKSEAGHVTSIAFHPNGTSIICGTTGGKVFCWDIRTAKLLWSLKAHRTWVQSLCILPVGEYLVTASSDCTIRLWDIREGSCLYRYVFSPQIKVNSKVLADTTYIYYSANTKVYRIDHTELDLSKSRRTGKVQYISDQKLPTQGISTSHINDIAVVKGRLLSCQDDKTIIYWTLEEPNRPHSIEGHTDRVISLDVSHDGIYFASRSLGKDKTIRIWDIESLSCVSVIPYKSFSDGSRGLTWSNDGTMLAIGCDVFSATVDSIATLTIYRIKPSEFPKSAFTSRIKYTSAKIVVVGESNVGKSYMAHRIATGRAPEAGVIKSTHGMKFWPLEPGRQEIEGESESPYIISLFGENYLLEGSERRDMVLWDMGGQEEYRLIHQLFLHDTSLALFLFDPTRGKTAFSEVESWNRSLVNQLRGRGAKKVLVGAKLDKSSQMIDQRMINRLVKECEFASYVETSAINGRGISELCTIVAQLIDWDGLGQTSRPELFQAIRDEIDVRRRKGEIVILFEDLDNELHSGERPDLFALIQHEVALASDASAGTNAIDAVCSQLAQQGVIARAKTSAGKEALVLKVEEVERYAGSLILSAKHNPRGVPALELRTLGNQDFMFPEILEQDRLPRHQELSIIECTVQLMLEHGICFEHEGLLVFPSLFERSTKDQEKDNIQGVSLYYDFAGAIDNIYASLVAWLVLAKEFGDVRLGPDRAEFDLGSEGQCGLRKVGRPGGFAHVDVYFSATVVEQKKKEFISFVEDHLARNGIDVREHVTIKCQCGTELDDNTLRIRIAKGDSDVGCPICDKRHSLVKGAEASRGDDPKLIKHTWALRTRIDKERERISEEVVQAIGSAALEVKSSRPHRILHLSDLHFDENTIGESKLQWLIDDIKDENGLNFKELDYLVISGDFTNKGNLIGFDRALEFVSALIKEFSLSAERCIFIPGNHDVVDDTDSYNWAPSVSGLDRDDWVQKSDIYLVRNKEMYLNRLLPFSDRLYHKIHQQAYPLVHAEQVICIPFWDSCIQFIGLNSCWQIDQFNRKRSGINAEATARAIKVAQQQELEARESGVLPEGQKVFRIAIWHHAVVGPEQIQDTDFLGHLQRLGVRLAMHGDVHELRRDLVGYKHDNMIYVIGAGSFGAKAPDRPESIPRLYNVIEVEPDFSEIIVHTRSQARPDGPWRGWYEWPDPEGGKGRVSHYSINLSD